MFEGLIARGIAAGEFRSLDPSLAAKSLISPMLLAAIWKTVFEPLGAETLEIEGLAHQHVDTLLRGMAP
jgi:hypothetical protein